MTALDVATELLTKMGVAIVTRITKNYEFIKGVGIDSTVKSTETRILLSQFSL